MRADSLRVHAATGVHDRLPQTCGFVRVASVAHDVPHIGNFGGSILGYVAEDATARLDPPYYPQQRVLPENHVQPRIKDLVAAGHPDDFEVKDLVGRTSDLHQKDVYL